MRAERPPESCVDVLIASDFRFPGGTSTDIVQTVAALHEGGYVVALAHIASRVFGASRGLNPKIVSLVHDGAARLITQPRENLHARAVLLFNALAFRDPITAPARITADSALLLLNHPVANRYGEPYYDFYQVLHNAQRLVGREVVVAPISGETRENFAASFPGFASVLPYDWSPVISVADYRTDRRSFRDEVPVIGRHSRPGDEKWPSTAKDLFAAYPARDDVRVRILGGGRKLARLAGSPPPANWEVFQFGDLDVGLFLSTIDFWVYFHDEAWVEAFGRATAEAMASGAVTLLPEHFRSSFAEGAIYCQPNEVLDIVTSLRANTGEYSRWSRAARRVIERDYSPERLLERVRRVIGAPHGIKVDDCAVGGDAPSAEIPVQVGLDCERTLSRTVRRTDETVEAPRVQLEVLYVGDCCAPGDEAIRVAQEVRALAAQRVAVGLLHLDLEGDVSCRAVLPEIVAVVREGLASPVCPHRSVATTRTVILTTATLTRIRERRPTMHVFAEKVLLLGDDLVGARKGWLNELVGLQELAGELFGGSCHVSTAREDLHRLLMAVTGFVCVAPVWGPLPGENRRRADRFDVRQVIGGQSWKVGVLFAASRGADAASWRPARRAIPSDLGGCEVWTYGRVPREYGTAPASWVAIDPIDMAVEGFFAKVDTIACLSPTEGNALYPCTAVRMALHAGKPVVLPERSRCALGPGPIYREEKEIANTLQHLRDRPAFRELLLANTARAMDEAGKAADPVAQDRFSFLTGRRPARPRSRRARRRSRRILFMSSNGIGVGHLSRLLAIARRLPDRAECLFLTMSQALPVVHQFGFRAEFFPYHLQTLSDPNEWNKWLQLTLDQIFDAYSVSTVVFDGSMPYAGLCRAVSARPGCRLVWVRRGMWRVDQDNSAHIARARFADLVIEPDDVASEMDRGASALHRMDVVTVDPIRLLDPTELLSRKQACEHLSLNPRHRHILLQLGSGNNFETAGLIDALLELLRRYEGVRPIIAEWLNAEQPLDLWPDVPRLRCFPISTYYRAFDFTVSAVGYNSFNEIISFAVPAVLVANPNQMMDDQVARAAFADANEAAVHLDDDAKSMLPQVVAVMMERANRRALQHNCRRLARPNGADETARLIATIAGLPGGAS